MSSNQVKKSRSSATFSYVIPDLTEFFRSNSKRLSKVFYVQNLPWRILTFVSNTKRKHLGFFLQCNVGSKLSWSCKATAEMRIINQLDDSKNFVRLVNHEFCSKTNDWGFTNYISLSTISSTNGYCVDDSIILQVYLNADQPIGEKINLKIQLSSNEFTINQSQSLMFNDLPDIPFVLIIRNLSLIDLIRMRRVNKRWMYFIDKIKIEELIIRKSSSINTNNWFYINEKINLDNMITMDLFYLKYPTFKRIILNLNQLVNIKRLKICYDSTIDTANQIFAHLYKFSKLEQLDCEFRSDEFQDYLISHLNLKIISIDNFFGDSTGLEIDCPNLEVLRFDGLYDSLDLTYPESLKYLKTSLDKAESGKIDWSNFNLEHLECVNIEYLDQNQFLLNQLENLKEFRIYEDEHSDFEFETFSIIKNFLTDLIKQRCFLDRKDLQIYYHDVLLKTVEELNDLFKTKYPEFDDWQNEIGIDIMDLD